MLAVKKCISLSSRERDEIGFEDIRVKSVGCLYIGTMEFDGLETVEEILFDSEPCLWRDGGLGACGVKHPGFSKSQDTPCFEQFPQVG